MCQPGALRRDSARMVPCSRAGTPPNTISQRKASQNARGEDLISSSAGAVLSFVLRDIRFTVFSFAAAREPGFSSAGPRHPPLLFRTVFRPLFCFPLLGRGPMNRCGLFLFSAFCSSAFSLFTPPLTGEGKRGQGKRGEWPLPFSRSQTVPHKLRYPSALCAAYLSISV